MGHMNRFSGGMCWWFVAAAALAPAAVAQTLCPIPTGYLGTVEGTDIALVGTTAYVIDTALGLAAVDVADPAAPTLIGLLPLGAAIGALDTGGSRAYVGDLQSVHIIDISDPTQPVEIGAYTGNSSFVVDIDVVGDRVYVVDILDGLLVLDVSDPAAPVLIGQYPFLFGLSVVVEGPHAYFGAVTELRVLDVSDPGAIVGVGAVPTLDRVWRTSLSGSLAYLATGEAGLTTVDISDPAAPVVLAVTDTPVDAVGVWVGGGLALVADGEGGLQVVDVTDPGAPVLAGSAAFDGQAQAVVADGPTAFVTGNGVGLRVLTMSADCPCPADFNGDDVLDIHDVAAFLDAFAAGDPASDYTDDGVLDFFDVLDFLDAFSAGCP